MANALERSALQRGLGGGSFADQLVRFADKVEARQQAIFTGVVDTMFESVVRGSALTGAPGQPVRTGRLRDSWTVRYEKPTVAIISTNAPYARAIEHNWRRVAKRHKKALKRELQAAALKSGLVPKLQIVGADGKTKTIANPKFTRATRLTKARVKALRVSLGGLRFRNGGPHSHKLTRVGFRKIVEHVARQVVPQ